MLSVHFGVRETELPTMIDQVNRLVPKEIDIQKDDTPWNVDSFERVQHVWIDTMIPMTTINMLTNMFRTFLVTSDHQNLYGVQIFVTDKGDPTAEYIELRFPS